MKLVSKIKNHIKKYFLFQRLIFEIKYFLLIVNLFFSNNKIYYNYKISLHRQELNKAHKLLGQMILSDNILYPDFVNYLSLSMRLRKIQYLDIIKLKIFSFKEWNPTVYIFILNNFNYQILKKWIVNLNIKFPEFYLDIKKESGNEKKIIKKLNKENLLEINLLKKNIKKIIQEFFFNDMQTNHLFYFSILESIISDHLGSKQKKISHLKKCAVINLDPWTQSYAHFYYLDSFIKGVLLGELDYDFVIFSKEPKSIVSNKYLFSLYQKSLNNIFKLPKVDKIVYLHPNLNAWRKKNKDFGLAHNLSFFIQAKWNKKNKKPIIQISNEEIKKADLLMSNLIPKNHWLVTLHVREAGYRFNDHLWLDTGRNSNISTYLKTINYLSTKNGFVVRLGERKKNKINFSNFFDYGSSKYKSDFFDIYFIYKSKFNIGTCSGPSYLPMIFGKDKNILTNINIPFFIYSHGCIGVPKIFKLIKNNKFIKYPDFEKINPPLLFSGNNNLNNLGLRLIDNNENDILEATKELVENFDNKKWFTKLKKRATFVTSSSKNIFCQNKIPLSRAFISKYNNLL